MPKLYHFTCGHAFASIAKSGMLLPNLHPLLPGRRGMVWLTDLDTPDRNALGLTSVILHCDRTEYRAVVEADADHWPKFARRMTRAQRDQLELAPGAMPMHWYVSQWPVPILEIGPVNA
jgi:hypothetical protein